MEKDVTIEHTYDAPLAKVWQAWTDPGELKQWWGPDMVSAPEAEVDLKVGGRFYIVMEAGEGMGEYKGTKWPMEATFTVVEPEKQLSYKAQAWTEGPMKEDTMIDQMTEVSFVEEGGKTKVKVHAVIYKTGPKAKMAAEGMEMGFTQQLAKLEKHLAGK
jgi:uncharacterized protein YndB with AHSA1/START domain